MILRGSIKLVRVPRIVVALAESCYLITLMMWLLRYEI